ncbi:MAG: RHS repeat-associated core domain-containing protein [Bryobacteraceae bacterium]
MFPTKTRYDDLARLGSVGCGSGNWSQTFTYDAFGNINKSGSQSFSLPYKATTNRINSTGYTYDANGNLMADNGTHTYGWDAEANLATLDSNTETYDALSRRVEQSSGGVYTEILYAPNGAKLALMSGQTVTKMFVPLPAGATAVYAGTTLSYYRHPDWLGSSRVASTAPTTPPSTVDYDGPYAPFGESYNESGTIVDRNFTGQNQDLGAVQYYDFLYREHNVIEGRWISPDPAGLAAVDPTLPQTWNRYAYVANDPLNFLDPFGPANQYYYPGPRPAATDGGNGTLVPGQCYTVIWNGVQTGTYCYYPGGGGGQNGGGSGVSANLGLGIRAPGQTWKTCMAANANLYSMGGFFELAANVATGTSTSYSSGTIASAIAGNNINTFMFGSTSGVAASMAAASPSTVSEAMGSVATILRRTTDIMSLNLAATVGGPPLALQPASAGVKAVLGKIGNALSLGLSLAEKMAVDAGFTAAEAINCSMPMQQGPG